MKGGTLESPMVRHEAIYGRGLWIKWGVLLAAWVLCALAFVTVAGNNELSGRDGDLASRRLDLRPRQNELRGFRYRAWDPEEDYSPLFSVRFRSLRAENSNLGFFKTALHKVIKIEDLGLAFYQYSQGNVTSATPPGVLDVPEAIPADIAALVKSTVRRLATPVDGWRLNSSFDVGNVSEIRANNFDCRVFCDEDLQFAAQSKRAIVSYEDSDVILHGHAKITVADGSTLESNKIKWDVKRQYFSAKGVYVLRRRGTITTGKGIRVGAQLESIKGQYAQSERKEQTCIAGL